MCKYKDARGSKLFQQTDHSFPANQTVGVCIWCGGFLKYHHQHPSALRAVSSHAKCVNLGISGVNSWSFQLLQVPEYKLINQTWERGISYLFLDGFELLVLNFPLPIAVMYSYAYILIGGSRIKRVCGRVFNSLCLCFLSSIYRSLRKLREGQDVHLLIWNHMVTVTLISNFFYCFTGIKLGMSVCNVLLFQTW